MNRGINSLRKFSVSYGVRHIFMLTTLILLAGAAGIYFLEGPKSQIGMERESGIGSYVDAIWWTAMLMTTIGSDYWPQTLEGRILTIVISFYSIAIFGYITATLATLLIEKNKQST